jgi:riboflavin kinase/FMN adenylyltransferase
MMNIGLTNSKGETQTIEIHYFDFNADLYNQKISVSVLHRLRSEQKFDSIALLKAQLKDKKAALSYLNKF